jgi:hypothetical protein
VEQVEEQTRRAGIAGKQVQIEQRVSNHIKAKVLKIAMIIPQVIMKSDVSK